MLFHIIEEDSVDTTVFEILTKPKDILVHHFLHLNFDLFSHNSIGSIVCATLESFKNTISTNENILSVFYN